MKQNFKLLGLFILVNLCLYSQEPNDYILANVNVVDMDTGKILPEMTILISEGKIERISKSEDLKDELIKYQVFNYENYYIIPGLIDGHVHTTAGPPVMLVNNLKRTLKSGITTVRDMGGNGALIRSWKEKYVNDIPDILCTTIFAGKSWIISDRRSLLSANGTTPGTTAWLRFFDKETIDRDISEAKEFGVNGVKIYADLDSESIEIISNKAKQHGLSVYGHATVFPANAFDVANSGLEVISHTERILRLLDKDMAKTYAEDSKRTNEYSVEDLESDKIANYLNLLKRKKIAIDATLLVSKLRALRDEKDMSATPTTVYKLTQLAYEAGVPIIAGTDYMINMDGEHSNLHEELVMLVNEAKLSKIDALRAATIIPSKYFKLSNKGQVKEGFDADLVILKSNPLENIENTKDISIVIKSGIMITDR